MSADPLSCGSSQKWQVAMKFTKENSMLILRTLVLTALTLFCGVASAAGASPDPTTESVWSHHIAAWEARDLDAIVSDYDDDSVLILNGQLFQGRDAIKNVFAQLFQIFDGGENRIDQPLLQNRIVYITWHITPTGGAEFYGTDTFVIENGVINVQTIASPLYDKYQIVREMPVSN
jgi:hypothetical protein